MLADEITVRIFDGTDLSGRKPGKRKFSCLFGIGSKEFLTSEVSGEDRVVWNEQSTIPVRSHKKPLTIQVMDGNKKFGKIAIKFEDINPNEPAEFSTVSITPSKKYPEARGNIQFKCWASHYAIHSQGSAISLNKGSTISLSKGSLNSSLSSKSKTHKKVRIEENPRVTIIQPKEAQGGDVVTVRGRHFGSAEDIQFIQIGDQICPLFTVESPSLIQLTLPHDLPLGKTEVIITTHSAGRGVCLATLTIQPPVVPALVPKEIPKEILKINMCSEEVNYDEIENFEMDMPGHQVENPFVSPIKETEQSFRNVNPFSDGETVHQSFSHENNDETSVKERTVELTRLEVELSRVNGEYEEYKREYGGEMEQRVTQIDDLKTENNKLRDQFEVLSEKYGKLLADVMTQCPNLLEF